MAQFEVKIESIVGGIGSSYQEMADNECLGSVAIDPETVLPTPYPSMAIVPVRATKFSGANITGAPMWLIENGKDTNIYVYNDDQKFVSYNSTLAGETLIYTFGAGNGNGGAYYNNYIYLVSASDVNRYGPLDNAPSMTVSAWTGATLGSRTALSAINPFPATGNLTYPNHPMHEHTDGKLYFGDYVAGTRATVNSISSLGDGTLPAGVRRALDLPPGYMVTDIESYGPDLAILCSPIGQYTSGAIPKTGRSALFLWDTFSAVPYREIDINDPLATALYNHNGQLRIWSGQLDGWVRLTAYTGGYFLSPLLYVPEGSPPAAGAVDSIADMLAWGSYGTKPVIHAGVSTRGYRDSSLSPNAYNVIQSSTDGGVNLRITSLAFLNSSKKSPVVGWKSDTAQGIDQQGGSGNFTKSSWRSKQFNIGQEFEITRIRIPLGAAMAANMQVTATINLDNDTSNKVLPVISNTVYSGQRIIDLKTTVKGNTNFNLQLDWAGTLLLPITLPITFTIRTLKDHE